uniref:Ssl1-like domain-containing protein n=1 Tax=Plectus sambesii TaxID=2011161 RepID=A0A914VSN8_9BILA
MAHEEDDNAYSWEAGYAEGLNIREVLREDESGSLQPAISDLLSQAKRKRRLLERPAHVRLGIMRHVFVLLDCSACMTDKDLIPSRISCVRKALDGFLDKFFEQNPISQIGVILLKDKRAEKLTELTGNHRKHRDALAGVTEASCAGEFSLQNALEMAMKTLK